MVSEKVKTKYEGRRAPWSGLGTDVRGAVDASEVLDRSGLDWKVIQSPVYTDSGALIQGFKANIRDVDSAILGIVSDKYQIIQNEEAFAFTSDLIGKGLTFETAGVFQGGRRTWIMAKMPENYRMAGDEISSYILFMNSHDGSCSVKVAMTPIRVACQNTLNLALSKASRIWSTRHTESVFIRMDEARETLFKAETYMSELNNEIEQLRNISLSNTKAIEYIDKFFPINADMSPVQKQNTAMMRDRLIECYFEAPDLEGVGRNAYRFINAVSDFATHSEPLRKTKNYRENLFLNTAEGNPMIDRAYRMMLAA